jgi:hypothetical protein
MKQPDGKRNAAVKNLASLEITLSIVVPPAKYAGADDFCCVFPQVKILMSRAQKLMAFRTANRHNQTWNVRRRDSRCETIKEPAATFANLDLVSAPP